MISNISISKNLITYAKDADNKITHISLGLLYELLKRAAEANGLQNKIPSITFNDLPQNLQDYQSAVISYFASQNFTGAGTNVRLVNSGDNKISEDLAFRNFMIQSSCNCLMISTSTIKQKLSENSSILEFIKTIISNHDMSGIVLSTRNATNKLEIFVLSVNGVNLDSIVNDPYADLEKSYFSIKYNDKNSLVESIDMVAKIDPNAAELYMYEYINSNMSNLDVFARMVMNGDINISWNSAFTTMDGEYSDKIIKDLNENFASYYRRGGISSISNYFSLLVREGKLDLARAYASNANRMIQVNPAKYTEFLSKMASEQDSLFYKNILGLYLRRATCSIHGTAGLNAYQYILVDNMINGLRGIYLITKITENINSTSYITNIESAAVQPLGDYNRENRLGENTLGGNSYVNDTPLVIYNTPGFSIDENATDAEVDAIRAINSMPLNIPVIVDTVIEPVSTTNQSTRVAINLNENPTDDEIEAARLSNLES